MQRLIEQGASEEQVKLAEKTYRDYNPKNILRLEREKFVNLMEGVGRYSGKSNYLTFGKHSELFLNKIKNIVKIPNITIPSVRI